MLNRKALADALHDLHKSDLEAGAADKTLKYAVGQILDAIAATGTAPGEDDSRHLDEAITALSQGHHFLARSSILLILEGTAHQQSGKQAPYLSVDELRHKLNAVAV